MFDSLSISRAQLRTVLHKFPKLLKELRGRPDIQPPSAIGTYFGSKPHDVRQGLCMRSGTQPPRSVLKSIVQVTLKEGLQRQGTRLGLILGL